MNKISRKVKIKKTSKQKELQDMRVKATLQNVKIPPQMSLKILKICIQMR